MKDILYVLYLSLGVMAYRFFIQSNFCQYTLIPEIVYFIIFSVIWFLILYDFVLFEKSILRTLYKIIRSYFYGNNKEMLFCCSLFVFIVVIITLWCVYSSTSDSTSIFEFINLIAGLVTIFGIYSFFAKFFIDKDNAKTEKNKISEESFQGTSATPKKTSNKSNNANEKPTGQIDITDENSNGFKVVLAKESILKEGKRFELCLKTLYVANYLGKPTGDNLWLEMNDWYRSPSGFGKYYPLINAQENNWKGNSEWAKQLDSFIAYLRQNHSLIADN